MAIETITVPDFGSVQEITVVEIYVSVGAAVKEEDALVALESEKAVMDLPCPLSGTITEVRVKEGERVQSGDVVALVEVAGKKETSEGDSKNQPFAEKGPEQPTEEIDRKDEKFHASPSVRAYARKFEVDLGGVRGSGPKGRIVKEDIDRAAGQGVAQKSMEAAATVASMPSAEPAMEDFSQYGTIEEEALGRIRRISGAHLLQSWTTIPSVTHFDEADITDLEGFRKQMNQEAGTNGVTFSPLVFIVKALVAILKEFPLFNCSLVSGGEKVILKKYYNIGIAVDTENGLVVPVIKNADKKGMREIALELKLLSAKAREGKLAIPDMQGAGFTISSLGGIGGTGFTPIVSAPQVAILGLSKNYQKPVWDGQKFIPRLTLPFSLSYDHRVIDGAGAARFCRSLSKSIEDLRRALL